MKSRRHLSALYFALLLVSTPVFAIVTTRDGPPSPQEIAQQQHVQDTWEKAIATPYYYWCILAVGVLVASFGLHKIAQRKRLNFNAWMHLGTILLFVAFVYLHFRIRGAFLEMVNGVGLSAWTPIDITKLPFLLGSSSLGAVLLIALWIVIHPIIRLKGATELSLKQCLVSLGVTLMFLTLATILLGASFAFVVVFYSF